MYTIGQFSRIGRISTKTLRFYDDLGLIKPAHVDKWNSYRYYSADQVSDILLINELKEYGFSLEEIKKLVRLKDPVILGEAMERKLTELGDEARRIAEVSSKIQEKIKLLGKGGAFMDAVNNFNIEIKERPAQMVCGVRRRIPLTQINGLIMELCGILERDRVKVCGPMMSVYHGDEFNPEDIDIEVCMPVMERAVKGIAGTREMPGGRHACTIYAGPYSRIGTSYAAIMKWISDNNLSIAGPPYEVYLVSPADTNDEDKYVTEICYPVDN